jgi:hypothetical protein
VTKPGEGPRAGGAREGAGGLGAGGLGAGGLGAGGLEKKEQRGDNVSPRCSRSAVGPGPGGVQREPVISAAIFGEPIPVARSYPRTAGNRPLLLAARVAVMSWK